MSYIYVFTGSRSFPASQEGMINTIVKNLVDTNMIKSMIVGDAKGVDFYAAKYAQFYGVPVQVFGLSVKARNGITAPYTQLYVSTYLERDVHMVKLAQRCIAVWDGVSGGTAFTYRSAIQNGLPTEVKKFVVPGKK